MVRVIYTEFHSPLWLDVVSRLAEQQSFQPVYWVGKPTVEAHVVGRYPGVVFQRRTAAIRGLPAPGFEGISQRPLDAETLKRFSHLQIIACKMMDRVSIGDAFRFDERTRLFHVHLRYWRAVLEHCRPDLVVFPVQPHMLYDYILYELCRDAGVPTAMFQWTLFHDWIYPLDRIDRGYDALRARTRHYLGSLGEIRLPERVEAYLAQVAGDWSQAMPAYLERRMPKALREELELASGEAGDVSVLGAARVAMTTSASADAAPDKPVGHDNKPVARTARPVAAFPPLREIWVNPARARKKIVRYGEFKVVPVMRWAVRTSRDVSRHSRRGARRTAKGVKRLRAAIRGAAAWPRRAHKSVRVFYKLWLRHFVRALRQGDVDRPLKQPGRRIEASFRGRTGALWLQYWRIVGWRKKQHLLESYRARCGEVRLDVPYVFVALHYQPEQTTSPTGGVFVDQTLMVEMLSRLVPPGWRVYVKEHPYQFYSTGVGERSRTVEMYDDMIARPNVTLVPWSMSPFELIDHSQAVATVSGTTGIEAAMRGKPVLVFGYAWYRGCEGVFYTPSNETCRAALDMIQAGYTVNARKLRCFLKATEDVSFRADLGFGVHIDPPIPQAESVERLAAAVEALYRRQADLRAVHRTVS